jgi:tetratricopeptide (TPR) repeat protein
LMLQILCRATMHIYNISTIRIYNISTMCIYNCCMELKKIEMNKKITLTLVFLIIGFLSHSQNTKKDVVVTDGVKNNITSTETGMYEGTKSQKAKSYFDKASRFAENQDFANAEKFYLKAIKEDPNFIESYDNLGRVYRRIGKLDKAEKYYTKSIELYPDGIMAHQNLAIVFGIKKDYPNSIKQYKEILRISPDNVEGFFGLANSYMMTSDFDKALINSLKTVKIYEQTNSHYLNEGYYLTGLINYYNNNKDEARKYILLAKENGAKINPSLESELFKDNFDNNNISLVTKEDYAKYEKKVIKDFNWLFETPIGVNSEKRKETNAFMMQWMSGSPNVSIELSEKVVTYMDCSECLMIFMGSWTKYALGTAEYSKLKANLVGTENVIEFYNFNKSKIGKNKNIEKFIKLKQKGKLEKYIKSNIK